ncbi:hypothetical protein PsYK624_049210 [Phanerochaete sordida]|uniref:Uncharacterized protein n=1 Tax=Phanerochaete sordida TaxID=48140 RepID=A0A9P3G7F5_9APHY|nr:hypothetical protein PsYK624_049210 [Phanerochaete sordida]
MFGLLPNLEQLNITQGTLIASAGDCSTPISRLKELKVLSTYVHSDTPQALLQLLSAFIHIDHLYVSCLSWGGVPTNSADAAASSVLSDRPGFPSHLQVSCLTMIEDGQPFIPGLLALMQRTASVHTVADLRLQCSDARSVVAAGTFLSHPNTAIHSLSIDLAFPTRGVIYTPYEPAIWRQLNLRDAHPLKHLRIVVQLELSRGRQYVADQVLTATSILDDCADALESITFFVWVDLEPHLALPCLYKLGSEFVWLRTTLLKKPALRKVRWLWAAPEQGFDLAGQRAALDAAVRSRLAGLQRECSLDFGAWEETDTSLGAWLRGI